MDKTVDGVHCVVFVVLVAVTAWLPVSAQSAARAGQRQTSPLPSTAMATTSSSVWMMQAATSSCVRPTH